jgi:hypothetical protein
MNKGWMIDTDFMKFLDGVPLAIVCPCDATLHSYDELYIHWVGGHFYTPPPLGVSVSETLNTDEQLS